MPAATHPPADALAAFGRGALPPAELVTIADHVAGCPDCCAALREVRDDSFVHLLREASGTPNTTDARTNASQPNVPPPILAFPDARSVLADHPQYKLLDQLGEGGMGVVFRAEHRVMGRVVALKVMAPHLTEKPSAVARFRLEVKAAARLNHPNIVTAHDAGEHGGLHFLVMEYVEGTSLDKLVARKGPLAVPLACQFVRQAAQGLQHAYQQGMVHRDIKPQNLMVTRKGQVKVLDFGLARFARDPDADAKTLPPGAAFTAANLTAATNANFVMGTPDYLSPEQAKCVAVDIRADVYSLGCTLYFLLTGRPPFDTAGSVFDKLLAHATEALPPVTAARLDVPAELAAVLAKMTAKDPAARHATPGEVAVALAPFARGEGAGAAPAPSAPVVEAAFAPAPPAVTPPPPRDLAAPEPGPTDVIMIPRSKPAREKRRKKPARGGWTPVRWAVAGGVLLAVVIGGLVVRSALKRSGTPTESAAATPAAPSPLTRPAEVAQPAAGPKPAANPWRGGPPQVLFVLPTKGLWVTDYLPVRQRLERAGVVVKTAVGPPPPPPFGGFTPGYSHPVWEHKDELPPVKADLDFRADLDLTPFRAVVFVGKDVGEFVGPPRVAEKVPPKSPPAADAAAEVVRRARAQNLVLGGVCTGQVVLAKLGALDGKAVARSEWAAKFGDWYPAPRMRAEDVPARADGRVVTGAGVTPEAAAAFADALLAALRE